MTDEVRVHAGLIARGRAEERAGRLLDAARAYAGAMCLRPAAAEEHFLTGSALLAGGHVAKGATILARALTLAPAHLRARHNLAVARKRLGQSGAAIAGFRAIIALVPADVAAHRALADLLDAQDQEAAATLEQRLVTLVPGDGAICRQAGLRLKRVDRPGPAVRAFGLAIAADPDDAIARFGACMAELPMLYQRAEDLAPVRRRYRAALVALEATLRLDSPARTAMAVEAVGAFQPYWLGYQGESDRALQELHGRLVCRVMAKHFPHWAEMPAMPASGGRLRVGIVSGYFRWHTIWKLIVRGWAGAFDRERFQLFGYDTGRHRDHVTAEAAGLLDGGLVSGLGLAETAAAIRHHDPHVLLYPEIGMNPMVRQLAGLRLAPRQYVSWGHPDTTGMPTIDAFLSSALMEPDGAEADYSERLERLPGLGIAYTPMAVPPEPADFGALGIGPDDVVYLCCQYLCKYLPADDDLLARIAGAVPRAKFVFIDPRAPWLVRGLRRRLDRAFAAHGLEAGRHVTVLPYLGAGQYAALNGRADVYLDSIGWSGGNTTLEAVTAGLPVVTLPGRLMRGRHSAAILRKCEAGGTIAADQDDYVRLAVELGRDRDLRQGLGRRARDGLANVAADLEPVRALERLIERAAATA